MKTPNRRRRHAAAGYATIPVVLTAATVTAGLAAADNTRLNDSVATNVYTIQRQAGCSNDLRINPQLQLAAQRHTVDVLHNRALDADTGTDGSTAQDRADAAGYAGTVAQTVAIAPAMAINGIEILTQWYHRPDYFAIMSDCGNSEIGVWSENSPDRSVVVAVYGHPDHPLPDPDTHVPFGPSPDYDGSDEIEYALTWLPWILRGVSPPPAYPPR